MTVHSCQYTLRRLLFYFFVAIAKRVRPSLSLPFHPFPPSRAAGNAILHSVVRIHILRKFPCGPSPSLPPSSYVKFQDLLLASRNVKSPPYIKKHISDFDEGIWREDRERKDVRRRGAFLPAPPLPQQNSSELCSATEWLKFKPDLLSSPQCNHPLLTTL